jgi:DNA-binding NarL/FixJ family response regulator
VPHGDERTADQVVADGVQLARTAGLDATPVVEREQRREREVLGLMAQGHSNEGIGERLFLSPRTVETHIRQIFLKLGLRETPAYHRRVVAVLTFLRSN